MAGCGMEVDPPLPVSSSASAALGLNPLKRSNSAPMINVLVSSATTVVSSHTTVVISTAASTSTVCSNQPCSSSSLMSSGAGISEARVRRFSTSSMALHSPTTPVKTRLIQIKNEETLNQVQREAAHEREVQMTQQITRNWDNLIVDETHGPGLPIDMARRPKSLGEPLHIQTCLFGNSSSPSPTRGLGKQCFSPSLQQPIPSNVLSPTPSPSPTRKTFRRSASPITLRPSPLGVKRKMEMDWSERAENYFSPPKRFHPAATQSPGSTTPDRGGGGGGGGGGGMGGLGIGPLMSHPLLNSMSCGSTGSEGSSPDQRVPAFSTPMPHALNSSSSGSGMPSTTSTPSPCYMFRTVRDSVESTQGTDSETSDMTETTDISEQAESSVNMNDSSVHMTDVAEGSNSVHMTESFGNHATGQDSSHKSMGPPAVSDSRGFAPPRECVLNCSPAVRGMTTSKSSVSDACMTDTGGKDNNPSVCPKSTGNSVEEERHFSSVQQQGHQSCVKRQRTEENQPF